MQEIFEKLIDTLKTESRYAKHCFDFKSASAFNAAITIVNEAFANVNKGNISDGYHTFNELYHHRAVLFAVICNAHKEVAWKSKLHDTGDMYDGMFIVGIETPEGQATYHYDIEPYWDMFKVKELEHAPKWDGHTPDEAIRRIGLLAEEYVPDINVGSNDGWIPCSVGLPKAHIEVWITYKWDDGSIHVGRDRVIHGEWYCTKREAVIAWKYMKVPAPYAPKGEK